MGRKPRQLFTGSSHRVSCYGRFVLIRLLLLLLLLCPPAMAELVETWTLFTPYQDIQAAYLLFLSGAKESIHLAAYDLNNSVIVDRLIELQKSGVKVNVI